MTKIFIFFKYRTRIVGLVLKQHKELSLRTRNFKLYQMLKWITEKVMESPIVTYL